MQKAPFISIVSPVYQAEELVNRLLEKVKEEVSKITENFEIILVEDGSLDNSWQEIEKYSQLDKRVKGIKLAQNFGQHPAIMAGLHQVKGNWVVVMDCDLQDRPEEIPNLYQKALEGYDVVLARRIQREDKLVKCIFAWFFYQVLFYFTGLKHDSTVANFGIYHQKVIQAVCQIHKSVTAFPIMIHQVGFSQAKLEVKHEKRAIGKSSYSLKKQFKLAINIILSTSDSPTKLVLKIGTLMFFLFLLIGICFSFTINHTSFSILLSIGFCLLLFIITLGIIDLSIHQAWQNAQTQSRYIIKEVRNGE